MKKVLALLLVLIFMFVSCGAKSVEMQDIKNTVSKVTFRDLTYEPEMEVTLGQYKLEGGIAEHYRIMSGTGATAEEITVFKLEDSAKSNDVVKACEAWKQERSDMYQTYKPDEMPMIEAAEVIEMDDYVVYICADDSEEIKKELEELFK